MCEVQKYKRCPRTPRWCHDTSHMFARGKRAGRGAWCSDERGRLRDVEARTDRREGGNVLGWLSWIYPCKERCELKASGGEGRGAGEIPLEECRSRSTRDEKFLQAREKRSACHRFHPSASFPFLLSPLPPFPPRLPLAHCTCDTTSRDLHFVRSTSSRLGTALSSNWPSSTVLDPVPKGHNTTALPPSRRFPLSLYSPSR